MFWILYSWNLIDKWIIVNFFMHQQTYHNHQGKFYKIVPIKSCIVELASYYIILTLAIFFNEWVLKIAVFVIVFVLKSIRCLANNASSSTISILDLEFLRMTFIIFVCVAADSIRIVPSGKKIDWHIYQPPLSHPHTSLRVSSLNWLYVASV